MKSAMFDARIYQKLPQLVLGFHGCDQSVVSKILNSPTEHLHPSKNDYDWLGNGIYFWLNDPQRALEWAEDAARRGKIEKPAVIGAVIDLGNCLNLCERESIQLLQRSYKELADAFAEIGLDINSEVSNRRPDVGGFMIMRELDCMIIEHVHELVSRVKVSFDTVYGYFQEGAEAYPGSGVREKSHIQIAVRNTDCIKGYFLPRQK